jgi:hypothetical protein
MNFALFTSATFVGAMRADDFRVSARVYWGTIMSTQLGQLVKKKNALAEVLLDCNSLENYPQLYLPTIVG